MWICFIAPGMPTIGLFTVFVMILGNFELMIEAEEGSALIYIMPGIIISGGVIGMIWAQVIQKRRPEDYESMRELDQLSDEEEVAIAQVTYAELGEDAK